MYISCKPSRAKPNKTYYQMDTSSFAKGGVSRLQTPFPVKDSGKGFFYFDSIERMNNGKPQRHKGHGERREAGGKKQEA